jgi:deazaflavin-dependent oxidoreductase (nitroreductase family)
MTDQPVMGRPQATPGPRAQTLAMQGLANRIVRGLLRTPLVNRLAGRRLVTVYVVGRKSGRRYTVPVAYTRHEGDLLIGTPFGWGRNLRTGEAVAIRLKGRRRLADVRALTDEHDVCDAYGVMARDNHNFAKFNRIGFDPAGNPVPADLHLAWAAGARAFRLTPRLQSGTRSPRTVPIPGSAPSRGHGGGRQAARLSIASCPEIGQIGYAPPIVNEVRHDRRHISSAMIQRGEWLTGDVVNCDT